MRTWRLERPALNAQLDISRATRLIAAIDGNEPNAFAAEVLKLFDDALSITPAGTTRAPSSRIDPSRYSGDHMMTDTERDTLYIDICRTMPRIGETDASLLLTRFALLSIEAIGKPVTVARLIADASEGLSDANGPAATHVRRDD
jgi:hypothetical protein